MNNKLSVVLLLTVVLTSSTMAEGLKQNINVGFANTSGNTDTLNLNGKYDATYTTDGYNNEKLNVLFDASAFSTENNNLVNNEEYRVNLGLEQFINNGWLGYANLNWLKNKFLNFNHKATIGVGIGKEIYNEGQHSLKIKLGIAQNLERYTNAQADHDFTSLNQYVEYNKQLNKVSNFFIKLGALENFDNFSNDYEVLGTIGLNLAIAENINVILSEEIHYDNLPALGFKKTDTRTLVSIGYHF